MRESGEPQHEGEAAHFEEMYRQIKRQMESYNEEFDELDDPEKDG